MNTKYEAIFIIKNNEDYNKTKQVINRVDNIIKSEYCTIIHKNEIGLRKLAYDIKGEKNAYHYLINFEVPKTAKDIIDKISNNINTIEEVIKYMIVRMEDI